MSNTAALGLLFASFSVGFAAYIYCSKWAHELSIEIVTGVTHTSMPLPIDWRWRLLYGRWVYLPVSTSGFLAFMTLANIKIADLASDSGIKVLAYFAAAFSLLVAIGYFAHGAIEFMHLRSILRDASPEAERGN